jgi:hypothetical protein
VAQVGSTRFQDRLQVLQALLGLRLHVGAGELAGGRIGSTLTGHKQQAFESHTW